jgi:hypothetical protein
MYDKMGLGVLYEIHASAGGYDPRWRQALLADGAKRLRLLVGQLPPRTPLASIFPQDFLPVVKLAVSDLAQAEAHEAAQASLARAAFASEHAPAERSGLWERLLDRAWTEWLRLKFWLVGPAPVSSPARLAGHDDAP